MYYFSPKMQKKAAGVAYQASCWISNGGGTAHSPCDVGVTSVTRVVAGIIDNCVSSRLPPKSLRDKIYVNLFTMYYFSPKI